MPNDSAAKRLGEALLLKPKLTEREIREAVTQARQDQADETEIRRIKALVRKAEFDAVLGRLPAGVQVLSLLTLSVVRSLTLQVVW